MGACLSLKSSSTFKNVRVVHLNGYVEYFEQSISASQVIDTPEKHFVCTSFQLLSSTPFKGDTQLQLGQVYFMLPYSMFQTEFSPMDLACLAKRLTAIAKTRSCNSDSKLRSPCRVAVAEKVGVNMMNGGRSPCRLKTWKHVLDTITEKSFHSHRSCESVLYEKN